MGNEWFQDYLNGRCYDCYRHLGCHKDERGGYVFRVYAPMAKSVDVIGDFNGWDPLKGAMAKVEANGLWEIRVPSAQLGQRYKYHIQSQDGRFRDKADPVGFAMERRPGSCSLIYDLEGYDYGDGDWMAHRNRNFDRPMSIYELHLGSWKGKIGSNWPRYEDIAAPLIKYVKEMGYTHVEFMPLFSYPFDGSWGYQDTGFFSIDPRYGAPKGLMQLIDLLHQAGIGVILDIVPVHFATDDYGLERFDGSNVYEYSGDEEYSQWGSKNFDLGKDPVRSFLISSAALLCDRFHVDGLRMDAVANIIYYGGSSDKGINAGGIGFAQRFNSAIHSRFPAVMTMAEDSSSYPHVTKGFEEGGLGFDYKWDLGWMNDTLKYYSKDPVYKKYMHNLMTFSMMYFYSENFILPLSHDEVVHGKGTILNKMWGVYDQKFALARNLFAYQMAHPGKKLSFMGNEIGSFDEWNETKSLPWNLLSYPKHIGFQRLIRDLNNIYVFHKAMHEEEYNPKTFQWIMVDNAAQSVLVFKRKFEDEEIVCVFNMTPNFYSYYDIGIPTPGRWVEILNTDKAVYGGFNQYNGAMLFASPNPISGQPYRITIKLPSFGACFFMHVNEANAETKEVLDNSRLEPDDMVQEVLNPDVRIISNKNKTRG